ncbi:hypothetical protein K440DRAFT_636392 [Wilcoxina mikolae CBS 423.85]|nr:hypothetical protein K440DRAFT_636392 [Wilcoxina mikolae CBS 423.85]
MAPRGGRGGGGGGSRGGGSSAYYNTAITFIYGHSYSSLYSDAEVLGLLVVSIIWTVAFGIMLIRMIRLLRKQVGNRLLKTAISMALISSILYSVRYGLLSAKITVMSSYRFESSVQTLLHKVYEPLIFLVVYRFLEQQHRFISANKPRGANAANFQRYLIWIWLFVYGCLCAAYIIHDFSISNQALGRYRTDGQWRYSDRDFGLTFTALQVMQMKTSATGGPLDPVYLRDHSFDLSAPFIPSRQRQISIGVATDFVAVGLALYLVLYATLLLLRKGRFASHRKASVVAFVATCGLLLFTILNLIVSTSYVLWNWNIVMDNNRWLEWFGSEPASSYLKTNSPAQTWLRGYRVTVAWFPVIEAVVGSLGKVMTCAAMVWATGWKDDCESVVEDGAGKGEQMAYVH